MLKSILDALLCCQKCGAVFRLEECIPCADGSSAFGCPVEDCGGLMGNLAQKKTRPIC